MSKRPITLDDGCCTQIAPVAGSVPNASMTSRLPPRLTSHRAFASGTIIPSTIAPPPEPSGARSRSNKSLTGLKRSEEQVGRESSTQIHTSTLMPRSCANCSLLSRGWACHPVRLMPGAGHEVPRGTCGVIGLSAGSTVNDSWVGPQIDYRFQEWGVIDGDHPFATRLTTTVGRVGISACSMLCASPTRFRIACRTSDGGTSSTMRRVCGYPSVGTRT